MKEAQHNEAPLFPQSSRLHFFRGVIRYRAHGHYHYDALRLQARGTKAPPSSSSFFFSCLFLSFSSTSRTARRIVSSRGVGLGSFKRALARSSISFMPSNE